VCLGELAVVEGLGREEAREDGQEKGGGCSRWEEGVAPCGLHVAAVAVAAVSAKVSLA
jgi:hypothetical protein